MDLIDVNKDSVTLMKYIGPFSPRITASDSKTLTNIFITKGSLNLEINPGLNPSVGSTNTISDVKLSQQKLISGDENKDNKSSENVGIVIKSEVIDNGKKNQRVLADRGSVGIHVDGKKTLTNLYTSKICTDANTSDQLKGNLSSASINKAVKQCTNLSGGLVDGNLANKSLHSLTTGESSLLSSLTIGMSGTKMAPTPHLDHTSRKSGIKSSIASGLTSIHCSTASGLRDVQQSLRSRLGGAHLGIKKGDSNSLTSSMVSSLDPRKCLVLLDNKMKIAPGGCVPDVTGLDAGSKLDHGKVKVNAKSLNKGDIWVPLPAIFADCQFALDLSMNMSLSEKTNLRNTITSHGGTVSFIVTKKSTHVICSDPEKADASYKCKMATKYGIPIICVDYVRYCADKGRLLNTDNYLLSGKTKAEELRLGKISASRQQKQETKQKAKPHFNVKNVKVWIFGEKDCPVFDEENYQIAKYAMFKKLDKSTETTAFCVLELHVVDLKVDGTSEHRFRVFCHHGILHNVEEGQAGDIEIRFAQTSEEVVAIYAHLYHEQMKPPHSMTLTFNLLSRHVGSQKFKQMMEEIGVEYGVISPAVSGLVNYVWEEAVGNLQQSLRGSLTSIKTEQIDKAEGILKQMREAVEKDNTLRLLKLKEEFYKEIPYQQAVSVSDVNKTWISRTFDLCQLIRDLIAVSEATDWSARPSDEAKYRALRCNIEHLESTSPEFKTIKDYLMQSLEDGMSLKVERIFHVHRLAEDSNFRMNLEPRKLLFHSSRVENFMGIFSRGLLMPRVVVDDHGGKRTDPGMLGSGIYFAEAGSTSAGYSTPGKTKGTRLMLINEVALGSCFGTTKHNKSLTEPPEGYQSVHGIKAKESCLSDFKADEYVVYNTNQQKMKYLVEFTLPGDKIRAQAVGSVLQSQQLFIDGMDTDDDDDLSLKEVDLKDVANVVDPMLKVKAGLVSSGDAPVDLKQVHISARLLDMVSQVVVIQEYYNNSSAPLEAKYVFPLDEMAAVCGFEAFINGKHIIGEVKEKETAHKEYKKAISEGHGAYLMDQDEETPDVFTISVGNLPPGATVFIKITYVAELQVEEELISFRLPGSVAPWSKDAALQDKTQSDLATVEVKQGITSLLVAVEMPFDIRTIECPTHKVKLKKTLTKAMVELCSGQSLSDGFQLLIGLAEIHVPRMWVERKDIDSYRQACMLSFYPEFEASDNEESDVIFLLDLSNSMKGAALTQAKKVLLLTLNHIPKQWTFNVIVFGTAYREIFPGGVCKTPENVKKVEKFVQGLKADMGNTEALRPLHSLHLLKQESNLRNVFLITDGHVNNEEATLTEIHCHCQNTRIFTFGVSSTANRHLLRALARMGGGAFEFFDPKSKSKWESKVKSQISKAGHIGLTSISVHWEQYDSDVAAPVQAPQNINAIFSGSRQVIYGFVPNCTMATLKAEIDGHEVSTVVSTSDLNITEGKILHSLTARAIIRDWEDGLLSLDRADQEILKSKTKNMIIELSKEYSIVTQFTSFVAIEKRDEDKEVDEIELLVMNDLIEREARDILQSMGYSTSSSCTEEDSDQDEHELDRYENQAIRMIEGYSSSSSTETTETDSYSLSTETDLETKKVLCKYDGEEAGETNGAGEYEEDRIKSRGIRMIEGYSSSSSTETTETDSSYSLSTETDLETENVLCKYDVRKSIFETLQTMGCSSFSTSETTDSSYSSKNVTDLETKKVLCEYDQEDSDEDELDRYENQAIRMGEEAGETNGAGEYEEDRIESRGIRMMQDESCGVDTEMFGMRPEREKTISVSEGLFSEECRKMPSPVPIQSAFYSSETSLEFTLEAQREEERMRQEVEERQRRYEEEWRWGQEMEQRRAQEDEPLEAQREEERMRKEVEERQRRDVEEWRRGQEERRRWQEEEVGTKCAEKAFQPLEPRMQEAWRGKQEAEERLIRMVEERKRMEEEERKRSEEEERKRSYVEKRLFRKMEERKTNSLDFGSHRSIRQSFRRSSKSPTITPTNSADADMLYETEGVARHLAVLEAQREEERMRKEVEERQRRDVEEWRRGQEERRRWQEEEVRTKCAEKAIQPLEAHMEEARRGKQEEGERLGRKVEKRKGREEEERKRSEEEEIKRRDVQERLFRKEEERKRSAEEERRRQEKERRREEEEERIIREAEEIRRDEEECRRRGPEKLQHRSIRQSFRRSSKSPTITPTNSADADMLYETEGVARHPAVLEAQREEERMRQEVEERQRRYEEELRRGQEEERRRRQEEEPRLRFSCRDIPVERKEQNVAVDHTRFYSDSIIAEEEPLHLHRKMTKATAGLQTLQTGIPMRRMRRPEYTYDTIEDYVPVETFDVLDMFGNYMYSDFRISDYLKVVAQKSSVLVQSDSTSGDLILSNGETKYSIEPPLLPSRIQQMVSSVSLDHEGPHTKKEVELTGSVTSGINIGLLQEERHLFKHEKGTDSSMAREIAFKQEEKERTDESLERSYRASDGQADDRTDASRDPVLSLFCSSSSVAFAAPPSPETATPPPPKWQPASKASGSSTSKASPPLPAYYNEPPPLPLHRRLLSPTRLDPFVILSSATPFTLQTPISLAEEPEELNLSPPQLPTLQQPPPPPSPPFFYGRDSMASPPAPKYYDKPMARAMAAPPRQERQQQQPLLSADLEEFYPLPSQSSLNISAVRRAPPPPAPPMAVNISPRPIPKWQQCPLPDVMHLETEEVMPPQSMKTLSTVSWRAFSVPTDRMKKSIEGDFERIRSRFLARMEHEPVVVEESSLIEGGTLGQVVTTDQGRYGIGVNVECIAVRPIRGPPANTINCIMKLQKEDGHWEFDADLEEILGVDKNLCMHLLYTAGLKSMGESAVQAIIQLTTTLIVLLSIYKQLFPSSHLTNLRQVDQQNNMYNKIRTAVSKQGFGQQFDNAIAYCDRMKKQYSLVPANLELGKSWEEMVGKMLDIHFDN